MGTVFLLTWTTYGSWLPGDARGFVSPVREQDKKVLHNEPGTPYVADMPALARYAISQRKADGVRLSREQAEVIVGQFQQTADFRRWHLRACAIMANHVHVLVGTPGDANPSALLRDFKAHASQALNRRWSRAASWWTSSGSHRRLGTSEAVATAFGYVMNQEYPLATWHNTSLFTSPEPDA